MKKENNYAIQGYLYLGFFIYFIIFGISSYFNIFQDLFIWTTLGLFALAALLSTGYGLTMIFKAVFELIESNRDENKRNILHQYLIIVPKTILILIIASIPFLCANAIFYIILSHTKFIETVCLPILDGVIGKFIWGILFILIFVYLNYQIYKSVNRLWDKYF